MKKEKTIVWLQSTRAAHRQWQTDNVDWRSLRSTVVRWKARTVAGVTLIYVYVSYCSVVLPRCYVGNETVVRCTVVPHTPTSFAFFRRIGVMILNRSVFTTHAGHAKIEENHGTNVQSCISIVFYRNDKRIAAQITFALSVFHPWHPEWLSLYRSFLLSHLKIKKPDDRYEIRADDNNIELTG